MEKPLPEDGYLYSVLNLPKDASQNEINERHRSLSLIFHPDKQQDENLKVTATKQFLEIQKAYQVLSDPFLRQVYDTLGSKGLALQWPNHLRSVSKDELQEIFEQNKISMTRQNLRKSILPKGKIVSSFDASPLFAPMDLYSSTGWFEQLRSRLRDTHSFARSILYRVEKKMSEQTSLSFEGQGSIQEQQASVHFVGAIRHQFSPRIVTITSVNFFRPYATKFEFNYDGAGNSLNLVTGFNPATYLVIAPTTISYSRRLFRSSPQKGEIVLQVAKQPSISFLYHSPATLKLKEWEGPSPLAPPTTLGLKYVLFDKSYGLAFDGVLPNLIAEVTMSLLELSVSFKASVQYGLTGLLVNLGARWSNETTEVASTLVLNSVAVVLKLDFSYLDQQLSLPIVLSTHFSPFVALGAVVIPSTATVLGFHFIIIPRRRAQRLAHIITAKKAFQEDSDARRERDAVEMLLKDAVRKTIRLETEREGLIIQNAVYGPAETGDTAESIWLEVTTPMQALVRHSQLHIPGGDTKLPLQGFSDPAPFASKSLRIRYMFRGRTHYAEIPDYLPVVLPLAEHQVNGNLERP